MLIFHGYSPTPGSDHCGGGIPRLLGISTIKNPYEKKPYLQMGIPKMGGTPKSFSFFGMFHDITYPFDLFFCTPEGNPKMCHGNLPDDSAGSVP